MRTFFVKLYIQIMQIMHLCEQFDLKIVNVEFSFSVDWLK